MTVIKIIWSEVGKIFDSYFASDLDVMSPKAKRILSNPEDKKKYLEAIERLKKDDFSHKETIKLSNEEEITLVSQ